MENYVGEITIFAYTPTIESPAPYPWIPCDGRSLVIMYYPQLFALIGNQYGGDGQVYFKIPDLRGRVPVGTGWLRMPDGSTGDYYTPGVAGGSERVGLSLDDMPAHAHGLRAHFGNGSVAGASNRIYGTPNLSGGGQEPLFQSNPASTVSLAAAVVSEVGGQDPYATGGRAVLHDNLQPSLTLGYFIATDGIFPVRP